MYELDEGASETKYMELPMRKAEEPNKMPIPEESGDICRKPTGWAWKFHGVGGLSLSFIRTRQILTFLSEIDKSLCENSRNIGKKV